MTTRKISLAAFTGTVHNLPKKLEQAAIRGLRSAAHRGKGFVVEEISTAKPHPAVDRGGLRNSVRVRKRPKGATLSVDAPHASVIEDGARPFFPPVAPLAEWARRKGLAATASEAQSIGFLIARAISKRGIEPRHFFKKGVARMYAIVAEEVEAELAKVK